MSKQHIEENDTIDLKEILFSLLSQWKLIGLFTLVALLIGFVYLRTTPNTYAVNAMVQVEDKKGGTAALFGDLSDVFNQSSVAQAEIEILKSRMVLGKVIKDLHLDVLISNKNDTLFNRMTSSNRSRVEYQQDSVTFIDEDKRFTLSHFVVPASFENNALILELQGEQFRLIDENSNQTVFEGIINQTKGVSNSSEWHLDVATQDNFDARYTIKKMSLDAAVNYLNLSYSVAEKGKQTGVLQLNYQGEDQYHLVKVLNHILTVYKKQNIERHSAESTQTLKFLEGQLPELKADLDNVERRYNDFRIKHNTVDIQKEAELYLEQSINLETTKLMLEQKRAELSAKYTKEHPAMREVEAQIRSVNSKINELNSALKGVPDLQRQYLQLYRDVEVNTKLYTNLLDSYQKLKIAQVGEIGTVRIIDQAVIPEQHIKPKRMLTILLSAFAGGALGVLFALAKTMLRSGIRSSEEIEQHVNLPVYATIPHSSVQEKRAKVLRKYKSIPILAVTHNQDMAIESLKSIRTTLHFNLMNTENCIISILSSSPEVGKSFVTVNLGTLLAQDNKRTLIIDADLRRGYLHKYFNHKLDNGLAQYLAGTASLDDIIVKTSIDNLYFLPRGKFSNNPSELIGSARLGKLLEQLSSQYDRIIIDTPPVLAVTDSLLIAQYCTMNLLIAGYRQTKLGELDLTINRFNQAGLKINGCILNNIQREVNLGYSYGYNYMSNKGDW